MHSGDRAAVERRRATPDTREGAAAGLTAFLYLNCCQGINLQCRYRQGGGRRPSSSDSPPEMQTKVPSAIFCKDFPPLRLIHLCSMSRERCLLTLQPGPSLCLACSPPPFGLLPPLSSWVCSAPSPLSGVEV